MSTARPREIALAFPASVGTVQSGLTVVFGWLSFMVSQAKNQNSLLPVVNDFGNHIKVRPRSVHTDSGV